MMEMEHEAAGSSMEAIRTLSNNYTLPADACATYQVAFAKLQEFEDDLFRPHSPGKQHSFPESHCAGKRTFWAINHATCFSLKRKLAGPRAGGPAFFHLPILTSNLTQMETATKPLKRNPNLVPLSREHHFGLLFCWKLKQGLAKSITPLVLREYVLNYWNKNLKEHLEKEEKIVDGMLPETDEFLKQLYLEHSLIRDLVDQIQAQEKLNYLLFEAVLTLVSEHIRFEERQFFPYLENLAGPEQLEMIGRLLQEKTHHLEDDFEPAFWKNEPVIKENKKWQVCF